ncbi:hypothetical protein [Salisaeta longa]|uniref:hypothetical protein n=1 Tax=Salisaeta longa TaxID=503170 RepID=UPI0003B7808D|nr:hypothetical protein [Salisaeta longa]
MNENFIPVGEEYPHHNHLVHRVLRDVALDDPGATIDRLAHFDDALAFLGSLCQRVEQVCGLRRPMFFHPAFMPAQPQTIAGRRAVTVLMPPACFPTEAHFVAIVEGRPEDADAPDTEARASGGASPSVPAVPDEGWGDAPQATSGRYFTLEHVMAVDDAPPDTMLCEWRSGAHVNYGPGPEPCHDAFAEAIARVLSNES